MPELSILLCGPALDAEESAASLVRLREVTLPDAAKYLVVTGKFDAEGEAKTVNVQADYPAETANLQTLQSWTEVPDLHDPRFRDGYDLYCLRRILARFKRFDYAVVLRSDAARFQERWPELQGKVEGRLFLTVEGDANGGGTAPRPSLLIDLRDERWPGFLDAAWELYRTGAVYGMESYTLDGALGTALEALEWERILCQPSAPDAALTSETADPQDMAKDRIAAGQPE